MLNAGLHSLGLFSILKLITSINIGNLFSNLVMRWELKLYN